MIMNNAGIIKTEYDIARHDAADLFWSLRKKDQEFKVILKFEDNIRYMRFHFKKQHEKCGNLIFLKYHTK